MNEVTNLCMRLNDISNALQTACEEAGKFESGNMSAGTRVRKAMQDVKALAQEVRIEVQTIKNNK